jgi:hypothetical protein
MPTLLPRESMDTTSVIPLSIQRPSPSDHRVGSSTSFTRLLIGSLALRPALLLFGNSQPRVATTPLPHATGANGQLPGRDFNPLDLLLLLRTISIFFLREWKHNLSLDLNRNLCVSWLLFQLSKFSCWPFPAILLIFPLIQQ